jgi:asparagine synthase (glutamine-hydrolysing)
MCGITGFIDFKNRSSEQQLEAMLRTMEHRGPDGQGHFFQQKDNFSIGLAHSRLSIIDLSTGASQPFYYGDWVIVFNGEIYNYQEIKDELIELGHQFQTASDTEVILHAWQEWKEQAVHKFIGMFVFVIYHQQEQTLSIYRDRAGVKPLYYYWQDGLFLFASELKAFHQHLQFQKELHQDALALFLKYCYVPAPHCIFKNCFKLEPGHFLSLTLSTLHSQPSTLNPQEYWNVNNAYTKPKLDIGEKEAMEETEKVLKKAFDYRMVADVPVGVFLSGGYDSSAVAALLQKDATQKIKTFTIGFHEQKYNEAPFAKEVAKRLGTDHTEYYCTIDEAKAILPTLPHFYDEPFGDSSAIPTMLVSQLAKKSVTVALSADGGDEIFGGYNRYPIIQRMNSTFGRLPKFTRELAYQASGLISPEKVPILKNKKLIGQRYNKARNLIREANATNYLKAMCSVVDDENLTRLLEESFKEVPTYFDEKTPDILSLLDRVLAKDYKTYMVDDILTKVDRATMSVSLEGREPFLDQHIIEWVAKLPNHYKIRNGNKKYLLKEIVHRYLPKEMMDRPKAGFAIPIDEWFSKELAEYFSIYLNKTYLDKQGIFNSDLVLLWTSLYQSGKKEYMTQLWNILMFQLWYEKWMK